MFKFGVFAESAGLKLSLSPTTRRWLMLTTSLVIMTVIAVALAFAVLTGFMP